MTAPYRKKNEKWDVEVVKTGWLADQDQIVHAKKNNKL